MNKPITIQSLTGQYDYIDVNKLNTFVRDIFSLNVPRELREIGEKINPRTGKSNYEEHKEQIYKYIDEIRSCLLEPGRNKSYVLSSIKYGDVNIVDINLYVHKNYKDDLNFYFVGKDLANYFKMLPYFKIISKGKKEFINHSKGNNHSRWYPYTVKNFMVKIAVNLRLLELYFRELQSESIFVRKNNILGSVILFEIPEEFKKYSFLVDNHEYNSQLNPLKIKPGLFVFQRNGVKNYKTNKMIRYIEDYFYHLSKKIFPFIIKSNDLTQFYTSKFVIGITNWDNHASIVIKVKRNTKSEIIRTNLIGEDMVEEDMVEEDMVEEDMVEEDIDEEDIDETSIDLDLSVLSLQENLEVNNIDFDEYDIWIVDPWKKKLKKERWDNLVQTNSKINIQFINRIRKDQGSEGSCVLCSFARILYTINSIDLGSSDNISIHLKDNLSNPIPDFIGYLTSYIFRNCI
jgi:hypothetical protein